MPQPTSPPPPGSIRLQRLEPPLPARPEPAREFERHPTWARGNVDVRGVVMRSNRNRLAVRVGSYIGFWTIMALMFAIEEFVTQNSVDMNHPISSGVALSPSFKTWYLFGFLSLAVIWFSGRNLLGPGRTVRWLAGHLAALAVYC